MLAKATVYTWEPIHPCLLRVSRFRHNASCWNFLIHIMQLPFFIVQSHVPFLPKTIYQNWGLNHTSSSSNWIFQLPSENQYGSWSYPCFHLLHSNVLKMLYKTFLEKRDKMWMTVFMSILQWQYWLESMVPHFCNLFCELNLFQHAAHTVFLPLHLNLSVIWETHGTSLLLVKIGSFGKPY